MMLRTLTQTLTLTALMVTGVAAQENADDFADFLVEKGWASETIGQAPKGFDRSYTLSYSEELFLIANTNGFPVGQNSAFFQYGNGEPCVLVPGAVGEANRGQKGGGFNRGPDASGQVICGAAALELAMMMPPTRAPIPPGGIKPDYVIPHKRLHPVNCDEEYWDCDDTAWAYCKLLPAEERANCHIFFIFSYGWAHALVIQRTQKPDGTWEVCLIEPSVGAAIYCWSSEDGELKLPDSEWDNATAALCAYYKSIGLDCNDGWIDLFLRYRYLNPADGWSEWYCGEKPWWQCGDDQAVATMCQELRDAGIDPCTITEQCPGCPQTPAPTPPVREYPGRRRPGEF